MSGLDNVKTTLADARTAISTVSAHNAATAREVRDSAEAMAGLGLEGVAAQLYAAADVFDSAMAQAQSASAETDKAVTSVSTLSNNTSVSEAIQTLTSAVTNMDTCAAQLGITEAEATQGHQYVQQAEVEGLYPHTELARRTATEAKQAVEAAKTAANDHRQHIQERAKQGK